MQEQLEPHHMKISNYQTFLKVIQFLKIKDQSCLLEEDKAFEFELDHLLNELPNSDRALTMKYLKLRYPQQTLLQSKKYEIFSHGFLKNTFNTIFSNFDDRQLDITRNYNKLVNDQDQDGLLRQLKITEFNKLIGLPNLFSENISLLEKFNNTDVFRLLDIWESSTSPKFSINFKLISDLVYFIFYQGELSFEEINVLHQLIANITENLIFHFQHLQNFLKESEIFKILYQQIVLQIQLIQIKQSDLNPKDLINDLSDKAPSIMSVARVALFNLQNYHQYYIQCLQDIIKCHDEQFSYVNILELNNKEWEIGYEKIEQIYFLTLFYYQIKAKFQPLNELSNKIQQIISQANQNKNIEAEIRKIIINGNKSKNQMTQYLAQNILFYFDNPVLTIDNKLKELIQFENNCLFQLGQLNLNSPRKIFQINKFLILYRILNTISHHFLQNEYKNYFILIQQLSPLHLSKSIRQLSKQINSHEKMDICTCIGNLKKIQNKVAQHDLRIILKLLAYYYQFDNQFHLYKEFLNQQMTFQQLKHLHQFQEIMQNENAQLDCLTFQQFSAEDWSFIKQFEPQKVLQLTDKLMEKIIQVNQFEEAIKVMKLIEIETIERIQETIAYLFQELFCKILDTANIKEMLIQNQRSNLDFDTYLRTITFIILLYSQFASQQQLLNIFEKNMNLIFEKNSFFYPIYFIKTQVNSNRNQQDLETSLKLFYYYNTKSESKLLECGYKFYQKQPNIYEDLLSQFDYFNNPLLQPSEMRLRCSVQKYPCGLNISLEEFNISLCFIPQTIYEDQQQLIKQWLNDIKNPGTFKGLIPLFFNSIKRGESLQNLLKLINGLIDSVGLLNEKALFQLFYNNCNSELQVMLLKIYCKLNPVPFVYRSDDLNNPFIINKDIFYIFTDSITIINFSFHKENNFFGKTDLINQIFYQEEKFPTRDTCDINSQTVDLMFDYSFNGSRNLCVADVHGDIPNNILHTILPLFTIWIIQLNSETEIQYAIDQLNIIPEQIRKNKSICFLVRNFKNQKLEPQLVNLLEQQKIKYKLLKDTTCTTLSKETIQKEINAASKFLYQIIQDKDLVSQDTFYKIIIQNNHINQEFNQKINLINELMKELETIVLQEEGFMSSNAFPIRSLKAKIKEKKNQYQQICVKQPDENTQKQKEALLKEIKDWEEAIGTQTPKLLLQLFIQIFQQSNYYIVYLWFVDKLRNFNDSHTHFLLRENQRINNEILALKQEKKQKDIIRGSDQYLIEIQRINRQIREKIELLTDNQQRIMLRNIGIEIFWRELIEYQQHSNQDNILINAAEIVYQMIAKGEPFEFLNGDTLQIDSTFLQQLLGKFKDKGKERVLVFSVLGPQSSGKSTILNKIFGCHFWTSVGRCTKGIYLQILKVQNQEMNQNLFDHIILLDTEGLQSPNQQDEEFDKKIALFVLTISDVILINVKGDINLQFKNLIEMCIFTLGELRNLSSIKQLSWCFNQNNNTTNLHPFILQLDGITQNLHRQNFQEQNNIDYAELLEAKEDNIKILGFSQNEIIWTKCLLTGIFTDWKQQKINHTYSEEAYCYGVNIIQRFLKKQKLQANEEFQNLQYCSEKMSKDWVRIDRLPDLLEFSQLIQHQQNLLMKEEFENIIRNQPISFGYELNQAIQDQIGKRGQLVFEDFSQIKQIQYTEITVQLDLQQKNMINQLLQKKNHHKISRKIYNKYEKMIKERIGSLRLELQLYVQNSIKNYETEFQKKKGFQMLDQFVSSLNYDQDKLTEFQNNDALIQNKFQEIWQKIINNHEQSQREMFLDSSRGLFDVINQEFQSQAFRSQHENEYKELIKNRLSATRPSIDDFIIVFESFRRELRQNQFMIIEKSQGQIIYQLSELFFREIKVKMENQNLADIIRVDYFYEFKTRVFTVKRSQLTTYMQGEYLHDLYSLHSSNRRFLTITQDLHQFFSHLQMIGVDFNQQDIQDQIRDIKNDTPLRQCRIIPSQLRLNYDTLQDNPELLRYIQQRCRRLQLNHSIFCSSQTIDKQQLLNYQNQNHEIILNVKVEIDTKNDRFIQRFDQNIFQFAKNPNALPQFQTLFRNQICTIISQFMENDQQRAWKQLYSQIFEMIHIESQNDLNSNFEMGMNQNHKNFQYNAGLINIILSKIQEQIKIFNKQLANFCVMLDVVGERCMFYFSMLIIWRIQCYGQYNFIQNNIQKLQSLRDEQFNKFQADIKQNKIEQSKIRGQALAQEIYNLKCDKLYIEYESKALKKIENEFEPFENSFKLIKYLDKIILEREDGQNTVSDDEVVKYVRNHKNYIEDYVNGRINTTKTKLSKEFSIQIGQDMRLHLQQVELNSRNLKKFSLEVIKAEDYFIDTLDKNTNYTNLLFNIVQQCIQGNLDPNYLGMIKPEYHDAFKQTEQQIFSAPIISDVQNQSDQEIQILKWFIQSFDEKIKEFISNSNQMTFFLDKLNIQTNLDEIKFRLVGCLETCPICKRKCDENPKETEHKHQCKSGHQLRGMNGVLIGSFPSLFTCEEIQDDYEIEVQETRIRRTWRDMKKIHNSWQFSCLDVEELEKHKQKIMKIWNNKIGQIICRCLTNELGQPVQYIPKYEIDPKKPLGTTHYIIMLDDSGSMSGQKWESIKTSSLRFLIDLEQEKNQAVTVIIFNHEARCVIFNQVPNQQTQQQLFQYQGGGTDFDKAFILAFDKLVESYKLNQQINKFVILFYTDGWAPYPLRAIQQFQLISEELKKKIEIIISTEESISPILQSIIDHLKPLVSSTELRKGIAPYQVQTLWLETITKNQSNSV